MGILKQNTMNKFLVASTLSLAVFGQDYYDGEDPTFGEVVDSAVFDDVDYDCYDNGWGCDLDFVSCRQFEVDGSCTTLDLASFELGSCGAAEGDAAEADDDSPCNPNIFYRILMFLVQFEIGQFGLHRLLWGLDDVWWHKLAFSLGGLVVGISFMLIGVGAGSWFLILLGVPILGFGQYFVFVDALRWGFGDEFYRQSDKCHVWSGSDDAEEAEAEPVEVEAEAEAEEEF